MTKYLRLFPLSFKGGGQVNAKPPKPPALLPCRENCSTRPQATAGTPLVRAMGSFIQPFLLIKIFFKLKQELFQTQNKSERRSNEDTVLLWWAWRIHPLTDLALVSWSPVVGGKKNQKKDTHTHKGQCPLPKKEPHTDTKKEKKKKSPTKKDTPQMEKKTQTQTKTKSLAFKRN